MYTSWRANAGPTQYAPNRTHVTADILFTGFIYAFLITGFALSIVMLGFRKNRICVNAFIIHGQLLVLSFIILCNFGQEWEVGSVRNASVPYKAGVREQIQAEVGVKVGLRGVNITLRSDPPVVQFNGGKSNETIDYNERFSWNNRGFTAGRPGYGPYAGLLNQQFGDAQKKGLPYPILRVAEHFTLDGGVFRWGRFYRQAGYYTHILIWLAFPLWMVTILLFKLVIRWACYSCMLTGCVLGAANLLYYRLRNPLDLSVRFTALHTLTTYWGWCFWINLTTACLTFTTGAVLLAVELRCVNRFAGWFGVNTEQTHTENNHWLVNVSEVSPVTEKSSSHHRVHTRPILSPRPGECGFGSSLRLETRETDWGEETGDCVTRDGEDQFFSMESDVSDGRSMTSSSCSSIDSCYKSPSSRETSGGVKKNQRSGWKSRNVKVSLVCHVLGVRDVPTSC